LFCIRENIGRFFKTLYNIIRTQVWKWLIDCCVTTREQNFSYITNGNELKSEVYMKWNIQANSCQLWIFVRFPSYFFFLLFIKKRFRVYVLCIFRSKSSRLNNLIYSLLKLNIEKKTCDILFILVIRNAQWHGHVYNNFQILIFLYSTLFAVGLLVIPFILQYVNILFITKTT
jgi:hypothetical protein